jgi:hypothetical protein
MAEPQPPAVHEGAAPPPAPAAASEAAALSSLDNKTLSSETSTTLKKEIDLKALNDAMKALESGSGSKNAAAVAVGGVKKGAEPGHVQVVKVDVGDVMLLVSESFFGLFGFV